MSACQTFPGSASPVFRRHDAPLARLRGRSHGSCSGAVVCHPLHPGHIGNPAVPRTSMLGAARNGTAPATVGMEPVLSGPLDPASGPGRRGSVMKCQSGDLPRQAVVHGRRGVRSSERFFLQSAFRSFPGSMPSWHRAKDSRSCVPGLLSMMPGGCTALMLQAAGCRTHLHGAWRSSRQPAPRQTRKKVLAPRFPSTAATVKTSKEREPCRPVITLQPPC